jgi:GntR family transcriptional regulator/MocR family aminotransferase
VQRHVWRTRRVYQERRDVLVEALRSRLGGIVELDVPPGGLALWARVAKGVDVDAWAARAEAQRVVFQPGRLFAFDRKRTQAARFGFARLDEKEMVEAVKRLEAALPR